MSSSSSIPSAPSQAAAKSAIPVHASGTCGQHGHWAPQCPSKRSTSSASASASASLNRIQLDPYSRLSLHRFGPGRDFFESDLSTSSYDANSAMIALEINGEQLPALLDSGSSHSFIDADVAASFGLPICPSTVKDSLGSRGSSYAAQGITSPVVCRYENVSTHCRFLVMPLNSDTPCIIGRDFFPTHGFRLTHATSTRPRQRRSSTYL